MSETDREAPVSSPARPASTSNSRKPIKPPTITPRRFKKFFTPISTTDIQQNVRTSRTALQDITNPPGKPKHPHQFPKFMGHNDDLENLPPISRGSRGSKRKLSFASVESPLLSSPLRPDQFFLSSSQGHQCESVCSRKCSAEPTKFQQEESDQEDVAEDEDEIRTSRDGRNAVRTFNTLSKSSNILSMRLGGRSRQKEPTCSKTWLCDTASFYSNAKDTYFCGSQTYSHPALPFCSATCNSEYQGGLLARDQNADVA
jgi:hypothetical protein